MSCEMIYPSVASFADIARKGCKLMISRWGHRDRVRLRWYRGAQRRPSWHLQVRAVFLLLFVLRGWDGARIGPCDRARVYGELVGHVDGLHTGGHWGAETRVECWNFQVGASREHKLILDCGLSSHRMCRAGEKWVGALSFTKYEAAAGVQARGTCGARGRKRLASHTASAVVGSGTRSTVAGAFHAFWFGAASHANESSRAWASSKSPSPSTRIVDSGPPSTYDLQ